MAIVQTSDFVGEYKVSQSRFSELTTYIDKYEEYYLVRLLGAELYDLFIADLTLVTPQTPQTLPYQNLFSPFNTDDNSTLRISEGIKQMLIEFIYFHYVRDMQYFNTVAGTVANTNENSTAPTYIGYNLVESFNQGISNYLMIQWYIYTNQTDYATYNGICLDFISGI